MEGPGEVGDPSAPSLGRRRSHGALRLLPLALSPQVEGGWPPPERWCEQLFSSVVPVLLGGPEDDPGGRQLLDLDCFLSDISDTLFTMTQPSPTPLQLPPEDGEGLSPREEACENPGSRGRVAGDSCPHSTLPAAPDIAAAPCSLRGQC